MGDNHDRIAATQLQQQLLDLVGRHRVQRGTGLVQQQHIRLDRQGAGDAEALLLAARQRQARLLQLVLDLVP
ncbi:MAG: hypothetical protein OHK0022_04480 [Roseiflexaceae bacterium]